MTDEDTTIEEGTAVTAGRPRAHPTAGRHHDGWPAPPPAWPSAPPCPGSPASAGWWP